MPFLVCERCEIVDEATGLGDKIPECSLCQRKRTYHHRAATISFLKENSGRQREASPRPKSPEYRVRGEKSDRTVDNNEAILEARVQSIPDKDRHHDAANCAVDQPVDRSRALSQRTYDAVSDGLRSVANNERRDLIIPVTTRSHEAFPMYSPRPNQQRRNETQQAPSDLVRCPSHATSREEPILCTESNTYARQAAPSACASREDGEESVVSRTQSSTQARGKHQSMASTNSPAIVTNISHVQHELPQRPSPSCMRKHMSEDSTCRQAVLSKSQNGWRLSEEHLGINVKMEWVLQRRRARLRQLDSIMPDMIFFFNELYHLARMLNGYDSFCANRNHVFTRLQSRMSILVNGADLSREFCWIATLANDMTRLYVQRMISQVQESLEQVSTFVGMALTEVDHPDKNKFVTADEEEASVLSRHFGALFWLDAIKKPVTRSKQLIMKCIRSLAMLSERYFIDMAKIRASVLELMVGVVIAAHTKARWIRRAFFCLHLAQPKVQIAMVNGVRGLQHVHWPSLKRISDQLLGPIALHDQEMDARLYLIPDAELDAPLGH